jgi:hypothetical protein
MKDGVEPDDKIKKHVIATVSLTASVAGIWSRLANTITLFEQEYSKNPSMRVMDISTTGPLVGFSSSGLGVVVTAYSYANISNKKELSAHELTLKHALGVELATQVAVSSAWLSSILGVKTVAPFLNSTNTLTVAGASVLSNIFLAAGFISIGLNLVRTFSINNQLTKLKEARDKDLNVWLPDGYQEIMGLSEQKKEALFHAVLTNDNKALIGKEHTIANKLKNIIDNDPSGSHKEKLHKHYSEIKAQRFERNGAIQNSLFSIVSVAITITMLAFPPSMIILVSVTLTLVVLKLGWDMYRLYNENKSNKELEVKINPIQQEIKTAQTPKLADSHNETKEISSGFTVYKNKWKIVVEELQKVKGFNSAHDDNTILEPVGMPHLEEINFRRSNP